MEPIPVFDIIAPRFRGEIFDYGRTIELGNGYEVPKTNLCRNCRARGLPSCRHFEIDTARQLIGPFRALADPFIRMVMISKAAQTLGSLVWDLWLHYLIVHSSYSRMIIFLENDQKAKVYCDSRLMPTLKGNPDISPFLPTGAARYDNNKTDVIFTNGKMIRVCGLNETNASSLTWQVVIIDEGWQHGRDGLLQKAMDRNKQVENRKTLIVGQCGRVKEDQDALWQRVRKVPVTWVCPCCEMRQQFGERGPAVERPKEFTPVAPKKTLFGTEQWRDIFGSEATMETVVPIVPVPGSYAGLQVKSSPSELASQTDIMDLAATAYLECYHCGAMLPDTPGLRQHLMRTYEQDYTLGKPTSSGLEVGFWNPEPVSVTIPFRDTMKEYIVAKKASEERGSTVSLEIFYMSRWARAWDENLVGELRRKRKDAYDVAVEKHDAWRLFCVVDNQLDLMTQWVVVWACKKTGALRQLWRGALHGLEQVRAKQLEYKDEKGVPILKDQWVFLDGQYRPEQICRHIIEHRYGHWANYNGERTWMCWNLLQGSRYEYFSHEDEKDKTKQFVVGDPKWKEYNVDGRYVEILVYPFSATACGQRFEADRDGKASEMLFLDRMDGEPADDHDLSHHSQIHSNKLVESKSFAPRESKMRYVPSPPSRPDHYFHVGRMTEAVKAIWGVDGLYAEGVGVGKV